MLYEHQANVSLSSFGYAKTNARLSNNVKIMSTLPNIRNK